MPKSVSTILEQLRETDRDLPESFYEDVDTCPSDEIVPGLIDVMEDDSLRHDHPKKEGPPVHAAELLGHLGTERALRALADRVAEEGRATSLGETAEEHLRAEDSESCREVLLQIYEDRPDPLSRKRVALCLAGFSTLDRRTADVLIEQLEAISGRDQSELLQALRRKAPRTVAGDLAEWFTNCGLDPRRIPDRGVIQVAAEALDALGAELDDDQRELIDAATIHTDTD